MAQLKAKKPLQAKSQLKAKVQLKGASGGLKASRTVKAKKLSVAGLKKHADRYFSKYIRYRDGRRVGDMWLTSCITCNTEKPYKEMQAGHFMSRRFNVLRYDEENVNAQCYRCNVAFAGEQYKYSLALDRKYGEGTSARLHKAAASLHQFTVEELQGIIQDSKTQIKYYEEHE